MSEEGTTKNVVTSSQGKKKRWYLRWWMFIIYFVVLLIIIASVSNRGVPALANFEDTVYDQEVSLQGHGVEPNAEVTVILNGEEHTKVNADGDGKFSFKLTLNEGKNTLQLAATYKDKIKKSSEKGIEYIIPEPPLEISEPSNNTETQESKITVKGKTESGVIVQILGYDVEVKEDGTFEHEVELSPGDNEIQITADNGKKKKQLVIDVKRLEEAAVAEEAEVVGEAEQDSDQPQEQAVESTIQEPAEEPKEQVQEDIQGEATPSERPERKLYRVVRVVDGDTIKVDIDGATETLRLIGMNTPETVDPRKPVECFGKEASARAKEILSGKMVALESDPTQGERDKYQRLLRYVLLEDGTNFNKLMISEGYAYEYTYNIPYKYQAEFKQAQREAEANKRGLWADGACAVKTTETPSPSPSKPKEETAPVPEPTGTTVCDCSYDRYNCGDFGTHDKAQACYNYCIQQGRGDVHGLDRNKDGSACESLP